MLPAHDLSVGQLAASQQNTPQLLAQFQVPLTLLY